MKNVRCVRCRKKQPRSEFSRDTSGRTNSWCKTCHREYDRAYYKANTRRYRERDLRRRQDRREFVRNAKQSKKCRRCGVSFPTYLLDYDHIRGKRFAVSQGRDMSRKTLAFEMRKCELLCVNCHRTRTQERLGYARSFKQPVTTLVRALKQAVPCADCSRTFPYWVVDFDHVGKKTVKVSELALRGDLKAVLEEISRCQVVCANCHRARTFRRNRSLRGASGRVSSGSLKPG